MLIGEGPGREEDLEGAPFIGEAGQELDLLLQTAELSRAAVYITNVVRCRPPDNRDPYVKEIAACRMFTIREIESVRPDVIVALGGSALKALTGMNAVGANRGRLLSLLPEYRSAVPVIVTYHPAAGLHNPGRRGAMRSDIVADLRRAQKHAHGSTLEYTLLAEGTHDPLDIKSALLSLAQCDVLTCDLEWEVLPQEGSWPWSRRNGELPELISIGLGGRVDGKLVAVAIQADGAWEPTVRRIIDHVPTVYHLGIETSDLIWLSAKGYKPKVAGDTYQLAKMLNVSASDYGLKTLAPMLTEFQSGWSAAVTSGRGRKKAGGDNLLGRRPITDAEWATLLKYNAEDCIATLLLYERLREMAHEQDREQVLALHDEIMPSVLLAFAEMAVNGLPSNLELIQSAEVEGRRRLERIRRELGQMLGVGDRYDLLDSLPKIAVLIESRLGITLPRTATGKLSLKEEVRLDLKDKHPVFDKLGELATVTKRHSTYWAPWTKLLELQGDGRLHTVYRPHGTITGRSSASMEMGATLQQLMRGKVVRRLVRARDGYQIVAADLGQIELREGAIISGDERLLQYYRDGKDVHRMTAAFHKAVGEGFSLADFLADEDRWADTVTKDERQAAKVPNFGLMYGGGPGVIIETGRKDYGIEFSEGDARMMYDAHFILYPGLKRWHERALGDVESGGVYSRFGRWRDLNLDEEPDELVRKAVNTPTQSGANDVAYCGLAKCYETLSERGLLDRALLIGYVHDSILLEVPDDLVPEVASILYDSLTNPPLDRVGVEYPIPIEAEVLAGPTWGDAREIEISA